MMRFFLKFFIVLALVNLLFVSPLWSKDVSTSVQVKTYAPPPPPPPGGGGGGGFIPVSNQVVFNGYAYPYSLITLLKDNEIAARVSAGPDARFSITLSNLTAGNYNFGIYSEDKNGIRSRTLNFVVTVTSGVTTAINGIFLPPTITVDKLEVKRGEILNILGQTLPEAEIMVVVNSEREIIKKAQSDKSGIWVYKLDTLETEYGEHKTKARAQKEDNYTEFSEAVSFKVGTRNVYQQAKGPIRGDLNNDSRVNLVDFSILAYWWKKPLSDWAKNNVDAKLKPDGKIDLVDFSILAYYWTG